LFHPETIPSIHRFSGGVPRLINTICDNCLFEAFLQKMEEVTPKIVLSVAGDLGLLQVSPQEIHPAKRDELDEIESILDRLEGK